MNIDELESFLERQKHSSDFLYDVLQRLESIEKESYVLYEKCCSYSCYLEFYIKTKLDKRKYERCLNGILFPQRSTLNLRKEINRTDELLVSFREKMYANPCKVCDDCVSRRKDWPKEI